MPLLELLHTRTFDAEMDLLRQQCFPGSYPTGSSKDPFDDESIHIVARADGRLAGAGRLIPRPVAFYRAVFGGAITIPDEPDILYFGRVMVAPEHRGHDLFELLMLEGLLYACAFGFQRVFGGMRPGRVFRSFVDELGYRDFGEPQTAKLPEGARLDQPLVTETEGRRDSWARRKLAVLARLRDKGYDILDNGCPVSVATDEGAG